MTRILTLFAALLLCLAEPALAANSMKPFVLASKGAGELAATIEATKAKLTAAGFAVAGTVTPYPTTTIVVVTNDALKAAAAKSKFGGYGAAQRVAVSKVGGEIQVSFTNPSYMAAAYRMADDLGAIRKQLASALGEVQEFGPADGLTADQLKGYHYMFGMEYFDEPSELNSYDSYQAAVAAVEKGLAAGTSGITKVYRIDIPGKEETVFGVSMNGAKGEGTMQDDAYIMSQIDFKELKSAAHLPYEILVSGKNAYSLYARFRIAINFPDLSMMGSNSFMSIMECPETIRRALTRAAGGKI